MEQKFEELRLDERKEDTVENNGIIGVETSWYDAGEEDDSWDDSSEDDDDVASALEWADMREGLEAKGAHGGVAYSTGMSSYRPNANGGQMNQDQRKKSMKATRNNMPRLESKFDARSLPTLHFEEEVVDALGGRKASQNAATGMKKAPVTKSRDRADRATVEQVLDPRTRMVLFKMLNRGVFSEINGCISTGKEANVYHATEDASGAELAIKVYKTAILVFKDRDRYVTGDSRFQRFCKSNPRKMVKMWAEKEMRNLSRLHAAGIPCPKPIQLRLHILVMEFLGTGGTAAPRLKDAGLPPARMRRAYTEVILILWSLYQKCRLVHADFSEYNLLVHNDEIHVIDVSQSVELDHPRAFDFLREDCKHSNDYFRRQGVATLTNKELFDFVVNPALTDENLDAELDALMETAAARPIVQTVEEEVAEKVWSQAYIPKKLEEVVHFERDHERLQKGENTEGIYYQAIAGMKEDMSGAILDNDSEVEEEETASSSDGSESDDEHMFEERQKLSKEEIRELRKANKKQVKADKAEKRKTKVKKHVKKRATKKKKP
eukprot:CAMPEP_0118800156 /NCGR_PEP_ID=MMETSP1161-20130426/2150_1 /TAXON_ID=249345 /ORGANISM="Picochlorum oklahomensis, Strain CCMP2329" /LENGTH=549 /DNA_ID=CAMNT_0006727949 /DNA_START=234 /DNA_END=1883 /DNA_ORIENTATION=-